jgi:hypothetical protein
MFKEPSFCCYIPLPAVVPQLECYKWLCWPLYEIFVKRCYFSLFHLLFWFKMASLLEGFNFQEQVMFYIWWVWRLWKHCFCSWSDTPVPDSGSVSLQVPKDEDIVDTMLFLLEYLLPSFPQFIQCFLALCIHPNYCTLLPVPVGFSAIGAAGD